MAYLSSIAGSVNSALSSNNSQTGTLKGAALQWIGDWLNQRRALRYSKELYDYQTDYKKLYDRMREAGINPGAALQGLSGSTPSMVSVSSTPAPNLTGLGSDVNADLTRPSVIASNTANAANAEAQAQESESRRLLNYQMMSWNPRRWSADIRKIQSEIGVNKANARYLGELATTVEQKRPWEIATLRYGLVVARATVAELSSRSRFNRAAAYNQQQQGDYWSHKAESESFDVFQHKWNNALLRGDWNPSQNVWQNLGRVAFTDPKRAEKFIDDGIDFLDRLDNKAKESFGQNYKRNAAFVLGMRYINDRLGEHNSKRADRIDRKTRSFMRFVPLLGRISSAGASELPSISGVPLSQYEDWFDYYSR